jgi:hypothetical protein
MHARNSSPEASGCELTGNVAEEHGGAVACTLYAAPKLVGCTVTGNSAGMRGGGFSFRRYSAPTVDDCTVTDNDAVLDGGGIDCHESSANISSSRIMGNSTGENGGGILCHASATVLTGTLIAENVAAKRGGGISCWVESNPTVSGCTFYGNAASLGGGGVHTRGDSQVLLEKTILAGSADGAAVLCEAGGLADLACCDLFGNAGGDWVGCIAGQYGLNGNFSADPLFCDAVGGDFTLRSNSPCLPGQHPDGYDCGLVGAFGEGCSGPTGVERTSWGSMKSMFR